MSPERAVWIPLILAAGAVGCMGVVALAAALLHFLDLLTLSVGVSVPLAALATRRNAR